jgi:hypothetical protein
MKTKHEPTLSTPVIKSGDHVRNNTIRRKWFAIALGGFLFTSIFALSAPPVEAQCQYWDVSGKWQFKQGSRQAALDVTLDLRQKGRTVITGTASHQPAGTTGVSGNVDGTVEGDSFAVHIYWANNTVGVYDGTIRPSGKIEGTGYEQRSPSIKVNWHSTGVMKCAEAAAAPAAAPVKSSASVLKDGSFAKPKPATTPVSGSGTAGGFIQMHTPTPAPTASAEADDSSSKDTEDQPGKHKKNKNKKNKHHHHHDDDQDQGND